MKNPNPAVISQVIRAAIDIWRPSFGEADFYRILMSTLDPGIVYRQDICPLGEAQSAGLRSERYRDRRAGRSGTSQALSFRLLSRAARQPGPGGPRSWHRPPQGEVPPRPAGG